MIRRLLAGVLLTAFLTSCGAPAATNSNTSSGAVLPARQEEQITSWTLPNGLKVHYFYHRQPQKRIELRVVVRAGSAYEKPGQEGLAHFLEHMVFNGTASFKAGEVMKQLELLGSGLGGDVNAYTSYDATVYHLQVDTKPETVDKAMQMLSELVAKPLFLPEEIEKERGVILAEKRERDGPFEKLMVAIIGKLFAPSTFSLATIGQEATINKVTQKDFREFWGTWYRPDRMEVIMVGDMPKEALDAYVQKYFAAIPAATTPMPADPLGNWDTKPGAWAEAVHADVSEPTLNLVWRFEPSRTLDDASFRALVREEVAGFILSNRLHELADKHAETFAMLDVSVMSRVNLYTHAVVVAADFRQGHYEEGVDLLGQELQRFAKDGVSPEELAFAVSSMQGQQSSMLANSSSKMSSVEADNIEDSVIYTDKIWTIDAQLDGFLRVLPDLKIDEVQDLIKSQMQPDQAFGIILRTPAMPADMKEKGAAAFAAALQKPTEAYVFSAPGLQRQTFPTVTIPPTQDVPLLSMKKTQLPNGVTLLSRQTTFDKDRFMLRLTLQGGPLIYPENRRAMQGFQNILNYAELHGMSHQQLQNFMQEKQIKMSVVPGDAEILVTFDAPASRIDDVLQLAYDTVTAPSYGERELTQLKDQLASTEKMIQSDPDQQMNEVLGKMLWGNDDVTQMWTAAERDALTLDGIRKVQEQVLRTPQIEVLVLGSLSEQDMQQKAANVFGSLAQKPAFAFATDKMKLQFPGAKQQEMRAGADAKSTVALRFPGTTYNDMHAMAVYTLLGQVIATKLFDTLREEASSVYGPMSNLRTDPDRLVAYLMVNFQTDPAKTQEILDLFWKTADKIAKEGISETDMMRARLPMMAGIAVGKGTNDYWFFTTGSKYFAAPLDFLEQLLVEVPKVTAQELTDALRTSVKKDKAVQLIRYPAK